jgi:hypothetical protein
MASAKIFRINYKSDFILTLESDAGWMTPFCIKFWTGAPSQAYYVGWDGETYNHCSFDPSEPTKLQVQFDDHHLPIGELKYQVAYHFTVADFPNDTEDEVINPANITTEIDGETYQVMLDFTGETAPEIQFALPAYANEAQRIANEQQRIAAETQRIAKEETRIANEQTRINQEQTRQQNEQQRINQEQARVNEYATLKADAVAATDAANDAATLAQQKAEYAQQQGGYAKDQGDYAKNQGDYAKEQGDTALADHQRAESDHVIAIDDHTQAGNDHTRAEADHGIAIDDHTQAGNDHTRAESDHATAAADHTQAGQDHTTAASDHSRAESDHTTAAADHTQAGQDHTTAASDHGIAAEDHTQAGNDHTRAESDHATAAADHTQAGNDHTRAESEHTRAESDHAAVEVYVDSLGAFDISAYHATGGVLAKYADLTAALGTNGANIPEAIRKGGMSVKYVQTSDNKYVQYRLMANEWSTTESNWQGVDDELNTGSINLVKNSGIASVLYAENSMHNYAKDVLVGKAILSNGKIVTDAKYEIFIFKVNKESKIIYLSCNFECTSWYTGYPDYINGSNFIVRKGYDGTNKYAVEPTAEYCIVTISIASSAPSLIRLYQDGTFNIENYSKSSKLSVGNFLNKSRNWIWSPLNNDYVIVNDNTANAYAFPIYFNDVTSVKVVKSDGTEQNTIFKVFYDDGSHGDIRNVPSLSKYRGLTLHNISKCYLYWSTIPTDASYCANPEELVLLLDTKKKVVEVGLRDRENIVFTVVNKDTENAIATITFTDASAYYTDNFGNTQLLFVIANKSFDVPHLHKLVYNTLSNVVEVKPFSFKNTEYDVTLTNCYSGYLFGGAAKQLTQLWINNTINSTVFSLSNLIWEQGSWDGQGVPDSRTNRIRTPLIKGNKISIVNCNFSSIPIIDICWYDDNKNFLRYEYTSSTGVITNNDASYLRVAVRNAAGTDITPEFIESVTFNVQVNNFNPLVFTSTKVERENNELSNAIAPQIDKYYHNKSLIGCVINDKFTQTSGSAPHLQIDDILGICFVSYLSSYSQYGETHGLSGLSVFPATQPHKAENYIFAKTGDLDFNGNPLDGAPFETNCLVYRNSNNKLKCRCFFNCGNQRLYYRDFDYETRTFDFAAKIVQYNGANMTRDIMSQIVQDVGYDAWGTYNGIIFTSNLYNNYTDGYIYACIEGTTGNPIVIKSNDNFANVEVVAVLPFSVQYECQICELSGTFYLLKRKGLTTSLYTTTDWQTYSDEVVLSNNGGQRPQCIAYNDKIWLLVPTTKSFAGPRQCYDIYYGTGTNLNNYTLITTLESVWGVVYISGQFLNGRLNVAFCNSQFMFTEHQAKDDVSFYTIPNIYEGNKPIVIN